MREGNYHRAAKKAGRFGFVFAIAILPFIAWFITPVRPIFDLHFLTPEINTKLVIATLLIHLLLGSFLTEIGRSEFFIKRVLRLDDEKYNAKVLEGLYQINLMPSERKQIIRKSCSEMPLLFGSVILAAAVLLYPITMRFIADSNALTYVLFSLLSLVTVAPAAFLIRNFFSVRLKLAFKEGAFKKSRNQAVRKYAQENSTVFLIVRVVVFVAAVLGFALFIPLENTLEWFGASEVVIGVVSLIYLGLLLLVLIVSIFVSYCPKCKWIPNFRLFWGLIDDGFSYQHYCRKCEKQGEETKCC